MTAPEDAVVVEGDQDKALRYNEARDAVEAAVEALLSPTVGNLAREYIGVKAYEGWSAQRSDHPYGFGPTHGNIWFRVGLSKEARKRLADGGTLTEEERTYGLAQLAWPGTEDARERLVEVLQARMRVELARARDHLEWLGRGGPEPRVTSMTEVAAVVRDATLAAAQYRARLDRLGATGSIYVE